MSATWLTPYCSTKIVTTILPSHHTSITAEANKPEEVKSQATHVPQQQQLVRAWRQGAIQETSRMPATNKAHTYILHLLYLSVESAASGWKYLPLQTLSAEEAMPARKRKCASPSEEEVNTPPIQRRMPRASLRAHANI